MRPARRFFASEVVQTSAMDCGPAALKCLLEGFGVAASYGRLREACQTDVDGTSIDTLEDIARALGLDARQTMLPADWVLLPEAAALPCLLVVRVPGGQTHFLVVWRRHGPWLQLMDPATGRRWVRAADLERDIHRHEQLLPEAAVRRWLGSEAPAAVLRARLAALGLAAAEAQALIEAAGSDPSWRALAALDAAARLAALVAGRGALARGEAARALLTALLADPSRIPERLWSVVEGGTLDGEPAVQLRGAVLLRVPGLAPEGAAAGLAPELRAAVVSAAGALALGVVLRALCDLRAELPLAGQRLGALLAVVALVGGLLLVEAAAAAALWRAGRTLEIRLRRRFLDKLPRLADRYFRSRPRSDMAERAHALHRIRHLPDLVSRFSTAALGLAATAAGIVWLDGRAALPAALAVVVALALPLFVRPALAEQDLKLRSHSGALTRFTLDALLGMDAIRAHGAARAVAGAHRRLLAEWAGAAWRLEATAIRVEVAQMTLLFGLVVWLVAAHLGRGGVGSGTLLLAYWSLLLPILALDLARAVWQAPAARNVTLRLLEPLGALEEPAAGALAPQAAGGDGAAPASLAAEPRAPAVPQRGAAAVRLAAVTVRAGGHTVLDGIDLELPAGAHAAVVGPSGAGKSSLLGLLLGWHRPAAGDLLVDGEPLDPERLTALRAATAWIDPEVQLWNASCLDNLAYGAPEGALAEVGRVLAEAELVPVVEKLPDGLGTRLGEGGARVSGGEGQRLRIGRALLRRGARLVLLDEPFRGLPRETREVLLGRVREAFSGATLLFVSHDVAQARTFPRVLVIDRGRLVEDGAPEDLLARPGGRFRALVEREAAVRGRLAREGGWRRLSVEAGELLEEAAG